MKMTKKVFKGLVIDDKKDNLWTAAAKGGFEGIIEGVVSMTLVYTGVYLIGKHKQKNSEEGEA